MVGADNAELCLVAGFFTLHYMTLALAIILTLLAVIVSFVWVQWHENRLAAALFIPYTAWVAFHRSSIIRSTDSTDASHGPLFVPNIRRELITNIAVK